MPTILPVDSNNHPIPAVRLKPGGAHAIPATDESDTNEAAFNPATRIISLYATVPVFIAFGASSGVEATDEDHYFPAGIYYDFAIGGQNTAHYTHLAVLRAGAEDGVVYVSEKE